MSTVVSAIFRIRRDTASNWTSTNPVLKLGEPGLETNTRRIKYGDGSTPWNSLGYSAVQWADITGKPTITSFGEDLIDSADATAARSTLGLGALATQGAGNLPALGIGTAATSYGLTINVGAALGAHIVTTGSDISNPGLAYTDSSVSAVSGASSSLSAAFFGTYSAHDAIIVRGQAERLRANANGVTITGSMRLPSYTVAGAPSASTHGAGSMIYVSNESGGAVVAFSDGSSWRRVTDRAVIS